jgi:hypothetical protein
MHIQARAYGVRCKLMFAHPSFILGAPFSCTGRAGMLQMSAAG